MTYQYDITLQVTYFAPRYESKHRYRFENVQFPNKIEPGDEITLPLEIREIGFDKLIEVTSINQQNDQLDLLVEANTETPKPILHAKLEALCAEHAEFTVAK